MANTETDSSKVHIHIVGNFKDYTFHVAKSIAEGLKQKYPISFLDPTIQPLFECDWNMYLCNKKMELCGELWQYSSKLMCFQNGHLLGNEKDLASWAATEWDFVFNRPQALFRAITEDYCSRHLRKTGHQFAFMDIEILGEVGRLLFELFTDVCPKTCKNFLALCTGELGLSESGLMLCYKGSLFHRIVPNGWLQGGDISPASRGNGGESIYGPTFADECFAVSHSKRGILGMANKGRNSNGSQFYITLQPTLWMDKKFVAFGQMVEGTDVLRRLEEVSTLNQRPKQDCKIVNCGEDLKIK